MKGGLIFFSSDFLDQIFEGNERKKVGSGSCFSRLSFHSNLKQKASMTKKYQSQLQLFRLLMFVTEVLSHLLRNVTTYWD